MLVANELWLAQHSTTLLIWSLPASFVQQEVRQFMQSASLGVCLQLSLACPLNWIAREVANMARRQSFLFLTARYLF
jgi:hypothetical protein